MESNSLVSFLPVTGIESTNIIVGNHSAVVKNCYLAFDTVPIKSYFKIEIPKDILIKSLAFASASIFKGRLDHITPFLKSSSQQTVKVIIPIITTKKEKLHEKFLYLNNSEAIRENFQLFGAIYTLGEPNTSAIQSTLWENVYKEFCDISSYPVSVVIDGQEAESPCALCKLRKDKIGDICMYKTNTYDCVFNCAMDVEEETTTTLPETSSLYAINYFENVISETKKLVDEIHKEFAEKEGITDVH